MAAHIISQRQQERIADQIPPGTAVHFFSAVGPCLPAVVIRRNRTTYTLQFFTSVVREPIWSVHRNSEPCRSCPGHAQTMYPEGYMD